MPPWRDVRFWSNELDISQDIFTDHEAEVPRICEMTIARLPVVCRETGTWQENMHISCCHTAY